MRRSAFPGARQGGFTLAEVLVALALIGLVFLPAVTLLHRLLVEDRRLDAAAAARLRVRSEPVPIPLPVR